MAWDHYFNNRPVKKCVSTEFICPEAPAFRQGILPCGIFEFVILPVRPPSSGLGFRVDGEFHDFALQTHIYFEGDVRCLAVNLRV